MDLSPALAKFYLARINPLLGEIVGPAIDNNDLPDVTMHVTPAAMVWPANEYSVRIEPMKVVLVYQTFSPSTYLWSKSLLLCVVM